MQVRKSLAIGVVLLLLCGMIAALPCTVSATPARSVKVESTMIAEGSLFGTTYYNTNGTETIGFYPKGFQSPSGDRKMSITCMAKTEQMIYQYGANLTPGEWVAVLWDPGWKEVARDTFTVYAVDKGIKRHSYDSYIQYRRPLDHTYKKLTRDKELKVAYFGGSVTAGYGSTSNTPNFWRAMSWDFLRLKFPNAKVTMWDASIGANGTFFGTYRMYEDVIAANPDLIFVEFAINDNYRGCTEEQAAIQYETVVRELRRALPLADIVGILVTDRSCAQSLPALYPTAAGHAKIAKAYDIPIINVGQYLVEYMKNYRNDKEWSRYFIDGVHPSDLGYRRYYDCIEEYLYNELLTGGKTGQDPSPATVPAVQSPYLMDGDRQTLMGGSLKAAMIESNNFKFSTASYHGSADTPHNGYFYASPSDTTTNITFRFMGTEVAMWTNFGASSRFIYSIDGGEGVLCAGVANDPILLASGLKSGTHTLQIIPIVYGADTGKQMKIGGIFARDQTKETRGASYKPTSASTTATAPSGTTGTGKSVPSGTTTTSVRTTSIVTSYSNGTLVTSIVTEPEPPSTIAGEPETTAFSGGTDETTGATVPTEASSGGTLLWLWIVLGVVAVAGIVAWLIFGRKK